MNACFRGCAAVGLVVAMLGGPAGIAFGQPAAPNAIGGGPPVGFPEIARRVLVERAHSSRSVAETNAVRRELRRLREAVSVLGTDDSPAVTGRIWRHRNGAAHAWGIVAARAKGHGSRADAVARNLAELWRELDFLLADPVGQRARLGVVRALLDEALREPIQDERLEITVVRGGAAGSPP